MFDLKYEEIEERDTRSPTKFYLKNISKETFRKFNKKVGKKYTEMERK